MYYVCDRCAGLLEKPKISRGRYKKNTCLKCQKEKQLQRSKISNDKIKYETNLQ